MKSKLGTISLSDDILEKGNIGLWAFELDEGEAPRMYVDTPMLKLIGLDHQVSPEETYHAWYDQIDKKYYDLVADAVEKMTNGEHAEVQYPWHHPNGEIMFVRCGGVRNYEYKKGIRIEGTHQDVTNVFHFGEAEKIREKENLLNYFVNAYDSAYFVNLEDDSFEILHMEPGLARMFGATGNDHATMLKFIEEHVHPEDHPTILQAIDKKYIKETLKTQNEISFVIREIFGNEEKTKRCQIINGTDGKHVAVGFMDITKETLEQRKHLLGAIPLSSDILNKANIGLWAFELDEGQAPRMYADEAMLRLIGLDHQVSPEDTYHAWYDNIDKGSYNLVADAVEKMTNGEHAEVQYPWHFPDGHVAIVRCGGIRNFEYKKGVRIEGTHQDVTQTLHFDEKERQRFIQQEKTLSELQFRVNALRFVVEEDPTIESALEFFGNSLIKAIGCDQVLFRDINGNRLVKNAPGISDINTEFCKRCIFSKFDSEAFDEDEFISMSDCKDGFKNYHVAQGCIVKSTAIQQVWMGKTLLGAIIVHYIKENHKFIDEEIDMIKATGTYLGLCMSRVESKKTELAKIEAESSNKAKTEFLFNMSHDIRTPMNAIMGFTDIAINHIDEIGKVKDSLGKIKTSSTHLLNLINDILEMSRIEAGRLEIENTPIFIDEAIEKVDVMNKSLANSKSISYESSVENIKDHYVFGDELHINQVIINLVSNAVKYTKDGGHVWFNFKQVSDTVDELAKYRIEIKDDGIGMSQEFQKHLFESFSREKTSTVAKQEGAGLGLAIVKRVVDLLGGTITVESKKNVGSTFIVEIPLRVLGQSEYQKLTEKVATQIQQNDLDCLKGKKILLVEDNELNREIGEEILKEAGFDVEMAEDGALAVKIVNKRGAGYYDYILMDIQMPVMNGYEATAEIRKLPFGKEILIIALSANAFEEDRKKSFESGMNDHVAKPINVDQLLKTLIKFNK